VWEHLDEETDDVPASPVPPSPSSLPPPPPPPVPPPSDGTAWGTVQPDLYRSPATAAAAASPSATGGVEFIDTWSTGEPPEFSSLLAAAAPRADGGASCSVASTDEFVLSRSDGSLCGAGWLQRGSGGGGGDAEAATTSMESEAAAASRDWLRPSTEQERRSSSSASCAPSLASPGRPAARSSTGGGSAGRNGSGSCSGGGQWDDEAGGWLPATRGMTLAERFAAGHGLDDDAAPQLGTVPVSAYRLTDTSPGRCSPPHASAHPHRHWREQQQQQEEEEEDEVLFGTALGASFATTVARARSDTVAESAGAVESRRATAGLALGPDCSANPSFSPGDDDVLLATGGGAWRLSRSASLRRQLDAVLADVASYDHHDDDGGGSDDARIDSDEGCEDAASLHGTSGGDDAWGRAAAAAEVVVAAATATSATKAAEGTEATVATGSAAGASQTYARNQRNHTNLGSEGWLRSVPRGGSTGESAHPAPRRFTRSVSTVDRLRARAARLREYCESRLGGAFDDAFYFLAERSAVAADRAEDDMALRIELEGLLGADNMEFWPLIDELIYLEEATRRA
jgi:hypothetical protein